MSPYLRPISDLWCGQGTPPLNHVLSKRPEGSHLSTWSCESYIESYVSSA